MKVYRRHVRSSDSQSKRDAHRRNVQRCLWSHKMGTVHDAETHLFPHQVSLLGVKTLDQLFVFIQCIFKALDDVIR